MILGYTSIVKVLKLQKHYGGNIQTIKKIGRKTKIEKGKFCTCCGFT
jgi:hypothetical protein